MLSIFNKFLVALAINFLRKNNYEICTRENTLSASENKKWFWTRNLSPGEYVLLKKIFEGKDNLKCP